MEVNAPSTPKGAGLLPNQGGGTNMAVPQDKLISVLKTIQLLKNRGDTEATNPDLAKLIHWVRQVSQHQQATAGSPVTNGTPAPANGVEAKPAAADAAVSTTTKDTKALPFNAAQLSALKMQITAYRFIAKNLPIPDDVRTALFTAMAGVSKKDLAEMENTKTLTGRIVEAARVQALDPASQALEKAYYAPYQLLKQVLAGPHPASRLQRLIIPGLTPTGLDPYAMVEERERRITNRVSNRIRELEDLPSNLSNQGSPTGDSTADQTPVAKADIVEASPSSALKLRALVELKSLKLLEKQKQMRRDILEGLRKNTTLVTAQDRTLFRRTKKLSKRDARLTERLERQHRIEREKRERQRHVDYLQSIVFHGRELTQWHRTYQTRQTRLGRSVLQYHTHVEREEQKRIERVSKERLNALKANDEEAYLKLLDQAKDTRITHLLSQTDQYLDSLTQAVQRQQTEGLHADPAMRGGVELMEEEPQYEFDGDQKNDYYATSHRISEVVTEQPSILVGGKLKDYQLKGLQWMVSLYNNRLNGILADEMGLGKTIQTISLITFLIERKRQNGPFLIIVPLSTLPNWSLEFEKWAPSVRMVVYKGPPQVRKAIQQNEIRHGNFQVLLTTFEYIIKDRPSLSRIKWVHMIIDEGHRMKNVKSKLTQTINQYYATRYRLILTGTPLQNNLPELWALLNFVLPKIFDSVTSFDDWFNTPFSGAGGQDRIELNEEEALLVIRRLHKVLRPFLLRRLKKDVESELPDKVESVIKCRMSALQLVLYNQVRKHGKMITGTTDKGKLGVKGLNNAIMQLRKLCNHPFVFEEIESYINPTKTTNELLYRVSGKFELLDRILPKLFGTGHRVLMFFQMTQVITIMEDFLHFRGWQYLRLDGSTKAEDRSGMLKVFNAPNSPYQVFLLSTRAGGLGLNLQSADTVIIFDSDWNPHQDLQAQDRAHRIGQTQEVRILRLITEKSVEEHILARAQYKLDMDGKVIQAGKFDNKSTAEEREAYLRSLLEVDQEEADGDEDTFDDDELNEILARGPHERGIFQRMDQERQQRELEAWRAHGHDGPLPDRLFTDAEVPDVYRQEYDPHEQERELENLERGNRARSNVFYADVLSEEQWLNAIENNDDIEALARQKRERRARRLERKAAREAAGLGDGSEGEDGGHDAMDSYRGSPAPRTLSRAAGGDQPPRKRGRPRKSEVFTAFADSGSPGLDDQGKPRGRKRAEDSLAAGSDHSQTGTPRRGGPGRGHKRRKMAEVDPLPAPVRQALTRVFETCYDAVFNCTDPADGRLRSDLFIELPSKRMYPEYYVLIRQPIAMSQIRKRMRSAHYRSVAEFRDDFNLMFKNACTFNEEGSWVYVDACEMKKVLNRQLDELCPDGEPAEYLAWKPTSNGMTDVIGDSTGAATTPMTAIDSLIALTTNPTSPSSMAGTTPTSTLAANDSIPPTPTSGAIAAKQRDNLVLNDEDAKPAAVAALLNGDTSEGGERTAAVPSPSSTPPSRLTLFTSVAESEGLTKLGGNTDDYAANHPTDAAAISESPSLPAQPSDGVGVGKEQ
ncbi:ATP-dependent DNA helicase Snf21 [Dimargaris verticillata]|uniref:ATP-dependent DNA helicase Snf21 n=1 Tax=Dimargaris verticillata TaxID=2761393 RepID=A0A9W8B3S9_9FUNG|nr:ATP-dependent DNA helicase Snf21 [Dimargaris verticillata]